MTTEKFISLLKHPEDCTLDILPDIKELSEQYPYFAHAHILLAKIKHNINDIQSTAYTNKASIYTAEKSNLFYYIYPTAAILAEPQRIERDTHQSGNYFEMIEKVETAGGDTKQSLKSLAERLKASREAFQGKAKEEKTVYLIAPEPNQEERKSIQIPTPDYFVIEDKPSILEDQITEEYAKKLIIDKKYTEAIVILNQLNLIYPKKSIYFADQIRFLEKILVNKKK
ncbi:MAG: hypothetical protein ACOYM7_04950 [Paludibacter sp.]